jgi:hypothetical protein
MQLPHFLKPEVLGGGAFLFCLAGIYLCRVGACSQEKYDYLRDPPHVWINGIPRGLVQVRGRVVAEAPLISPLTQSPCCYYQTTIQREKPGKTGQFTTIHREVKSRDFVIDDGTGKIPIITAGAQYDLPQTYSAVVDWSAPGLIKDSRGPTIGQATPPSSEHVGLFLARHGIGKRGAGNGEGKAVEGGAFRITEQCLAVGAEASVFGTCEVCFSPGEPRGRKVIVKNSHLPTLLVTNNIELRVSPRLHFIAIAAYTCGILLIGMSLASALLLVYPRFV